MSDLAVRRDAAEAVSLPAWPRRAYEIGVTVALVGWFVLGFTHSTRVIEDPLLLEWIFAILIVDLLPRALIDLTARNLQPQGAIR